MTWISSLRIKLACEVSKTMWVALNAHELLIAADNQENHRQLDHMSLQTFVAPAHSTPQEMTELVNTLRTMFDLRFITSGQTAGELDVRAPAPILAACAKLLAQLDNERPQVMLELSGLPDRSPADAQHRAAHSEHVSICTTFRPRRWPVSADRIFRISSTS